MVFLPLWEVPPEINPEIARPGVTALLIVLGTCVVVALLGWSMFRHMRKVRENFADEIHDAQPFEQDDDTDPAVGPAESVSIRRPAGPGEPKAGE